MRQLRLVVLGAFLSAAGPVAAQSIVVDDGGFLTPQEEQRLAFALRTYADSTSNQFIIRTVASLDGADIATYATELGQSLGVGQQEEDNGLVIAVARQEREVFIAVGYGLEGVITDALAARVIRNVITPAFREGQFYSGLASAADILMQAAAGEYQADDVPAGLHADAWTLGEVVWFLIVLMVVGLIVLGFSSGRGGGGRRRRRGGMDDVIPLMFLLGHMGGRSSGGFGGGGGFSSGGMGGFSGGFGGGGFGGGGAGGSW